MDFYVYCASRFVWPKMGIVTGRNRWMGMPIIQKAPDSSISIGHGGMYCSRSLQTALGVNHPIVIRTLKSGAVLSIGSNVRMSGTTICAAMKLTIGDRCVIGANAMIVDTDFHSMDPSVRNSKEDARQAISKPVSIGDDVFIGANAVILKGVTVGNGAVIGSNSVVTKDVDAGAIVAGNPAKQIGLV